MTSKRVRLQKPVPGWTLEAVSANGNVRFELTHPSGVLSRFNSVADARKFARKHGDNPIRPDSADIFPPHTRCYFCGAIGSTDQDGCTCHDCAGRGMMELVKP